jgi:hypothetical protein
MEHEQSFMMAVSQELCIRSLGAKVVDLEGRLKTLASECERELNRIHEILKTPANTKSMPVQDKDNMWTRRFK